MTFTLGGLSEVYWCFEGALSKSGFYPVDTEARGLLPFYANLVKLYTFTVLRQNALTFTLPPPYDIVHSFTRPPRPRDRALTSYRAPQVSSKRLAVTPHTAHVGGVGAIAPLLRINATQRRGRDAGRPAALFSTCKDCYIKAKGRYTQAPTRCSSAPHPRRS